MEFFEVIEKRHSIRSYKDVPVEKEKLERLLSACLKAPSAGNLQAYKIYVIRNQKIRYALGEAAFGQHFISKAPIVLVFCSLPRKSASKYGSRGANLYSIQDATIAASYAQLAATALGLASCWVGAFDENAVKEILGLEEEKPIAIIPLGYGAEEPLSPPKENIEKIVKIIE